jgi:membrane-associated protease RseP (regulator of RpoE activity)
MNIYALLLIVFIVYWLIILLFDKRGVLERYNISAYGPILMIRTQRGQKLLEILSKRKRLCRMLANAGIPLMIVSMVFMFGVILLDYYVMLFHTPPPSELMNPRVMLLLPGINPFVPIVWGLIGLIVTIVVHEISHAVLCKTEGIRVKSMGLILALIPIGAFAEPDEDQLFEEEDIGVKLRVLSAGVISNFFVALVAFSIFFGLVLPSISPVADGLPVMEVMDGYPAEEAGIERGMIITGINEREIKTRQDFLNYMEKTYPGEIIRIRVHDGWTFDLELAENPENSKIGYLGITSYDTGEMLDWLRSIPGQLSSINGWLILLTLPFLGFSGFTSIASFYEATGFGSFLGNGIFSIADLLFWIAWINLLAGVFNSLPAIPLDGGHVFREMMKKLFGERISNHLATFFSFIVFTSILLLFIAPYIVHGF